MKELVLIRGLPGSGKSTFASLIKKEGWFHHETDSFFINGEGEYKFDHKVIGSAHKWNQLRTESEMSKGHSGIVSNTFTTRKEMEPYLFLAEKYGYRVTKIVMQGSHGSVHGVPEETIKRMKGRWED